MDGFQNSWSAATVASKDKGGTFTVEYAAFVDGKGKALSESVRAT